MLRLLGNRKVLSVKGKGVIGFLQGLVTQDVQKFLAPDCHALAAVFLNPKGRIISDTLLVRNDSEEIWLDLPLAQFETVKSMLLRHKLRLPLQIESAPLSVFYTDINGFPDPRSAALPNRIIAPLAEETTDGSEEYKRMRLLAGIPEGSEAENGIPIFYNFDLFNAISFNKGCYTGQELVTRTVRRGIVRKRLFVCSTEQPVGSTVTGNGEAIGTVIASASDVSLCLLSLSNAALNEPAQIMEAVQNTCMRTLHCLDWVRCGSKASSKDDSTTLDGREFFDRDQCVPPDPLVDPVVFVDKYGFEWALREPDDEDLSPKLASFPTVLPICVRPVKGFLRNQVLTNSEVQDPSPFVSVAAFQPPGKSRPIEQEEIFRKFRSLAVQVIQTSGAHIRHGPKRVLIRNDAGSPRRRHTTILPISNKRSLEYLRKSLHR